ncbi:hypothetical protein HYV89_03270 [Candidatus Woesearchaeota archaeon]|nr:hypothetical protein [Candidatus Woesearchaeota archaeon]
MPRTRTALVGVRNDSNRRQIYDLLFKKLDYITTTVSTQEKMLMLMNKREYDLYLAELDLGNPGSNDTAAAKNLYHSLENRIKENSAKFLCLCDNLTGLSKAYSDGIPACKTSKFISDPGKFIKIN